MALRVGDLMAAWSNTERRDPARLLKRFAAGMNEWLSGSRTTASN